MQVVAAALLLPLAFLLVCAPTSHADKECPAWENSTSETELLTHMTLPCRYDRFTRPGTPGVTLPVYVRVHVYFLGSIEAHSLQFSAHILTRIRWRDPRLEYSTLAPTVRHMVSESFLRDRIWTPHIYFVNEQHSTVMGADRKDVLVTVEPDGTTVFSSRMVVRLSCLMNLQKFPFDQQFCPLILESWTYDSTEMMLHWEDGEPVSINHELQLPEYRLINTWSNQSVVSYSLGNEEPSYYGKFSGNYSTLSVKFHLAREVGHYIMDYFVPSILLVVVSWVSFWLDPNAIPGRTTLGTSTMLTFITLTRNTGSSLPKVSYIKATEVWFIVCTAFIFGSLVEFAFVNTIWRRKKNVELKKVNSKYILKSTLTPQLKRKNLSNSNIDRCQSWPSVLEDQTTQSSDLQFYLGNNTSSNTLTVNSAESINNSPLPSNQTKNGDLGYDSIMIPVPNSPNSKSTANQNNKGFTTMTPQEIAQWIDRRSRLLFPIAFILFNFMYWGFVWI